MAGCSGKGGKEEPGPGPEPEHTHEADAYGFCACGEYMGQTISHIEEDALGFIVNWESVKANKPEYFRFPITSGHGIHLEDCDAWDAHDLEDQIKTYVRNGTEMSEVFYPVTDSSVTPILTGEDGYVYAVANPAEDYSTPMLYFLEDHIFNDAGVCEVDGEFIELCNGNRGEVIPKGSESKIGINLAADGKTSYYKIVKDTLGFEKHKFNIHLTNIAEDHVELYCLDEMRHAVKIAYAEGHEDAVPEGVEELYIAIHHVIAINNGKFSLTRVDHGAEHGYCPSCGIIVDGIQLTMNDDYCTPFDIAAGDVYNCYFNFLDPEQVENFGIQFNGSTAQLDGEVPSFELYVYSERDGFTYVEPVEGTVSTVTVEYDLTSYYYECEYAFFEFTALSTMSGVSLRVHDFA